ncbi:MAG: cupredoxin domain-containing protein [Thermoleophilaceae bacterium]
MTVKLGIALSTLAAVLVAAIGLALAGGDGGAGSSPTSAGGVAEKTTKVTVADFDFEPPAIEVKAGSKVTFTNKDSAVHTATSEEEGLFDSDDLEQGKPRSVSFDKPGTFAYYCVYHATMKGEVVVK